MDARALLKSRFEEKLGVKRTRLAHSLKTAKARIEDALRDLEKNEPIDDHLVVNIAHVATEIATYNLVLETLPYLEGE